MCIRDRVSDSIINGDNNSIMTPVMIILMVYLSKLRYLYPLLQVHICEWSQKWTQYMNTIWIIWSNSRMMRVEK